MTIALRPAETKLSPTVATAEIIYRADEAGVTRLKRLHQQAPQRVLFPRMPVGELPTAVLVNTSGGLVGGDQVRVRIEAAQGARLLTAAQAAEKVYRSTGDTVTVEMDLAVGPGGWLEYLPQETILFDQARLRRRTRLDLRGDASAMAGEILVFGRTAHGEAVATGLARDAWEVSRDGRLVWADALHLEGDIAAQLGASAGFGGAHACATLILAAKELEALRDWMRDSTAPDGVRFGVTLVNGLLVARCLAHDARVMRDHFGTLWAGLRHRAGSCPEQLPRFWHI